MEATHARHARTAGAILKKNLIGLAGGIALIVVVFFTKTGQDVAPVVPKIPSPPPQTVPAETDISSLLIEGAEQAFLLAERANDTVEAIEAGNTIVDLSGFHAALRQDNHREAVDRWYQRVLQRAIATNNRRARDFLTADTTNFRIRVVLDMTDFGKNIFIPLYESGAEIDLEKSLRPIINGLTDHEQEETFKTFKEALEVRHQTLLKVARVIADEDGSPSITEEHMMRARQATAIEISRRKSGE